MKKSLFFIMVCVLTLVSCTDKQSTVETSIQKIRDEQAWIEKYQMISIHSETKTVKIHFMKGESPFFDISVLSSKSKSVDISFYRLKDITPEGRVKRGKLPVRTFMIFIPVDETPESWGHGGLDLVRSDGEIHHIDFVLVDQPL